MAGQTDKALIASLRKLADVAAKYFDTLSKFGLTRSDIEEGRALADTLERLKAEKKELKEAMKRNKAKREALRAERRSRLN